MSDPKPEIDAPAVPPETLDLAHSTPSSGVHRGAANPAARLRPPEVPDEVGRLGGFRVLKLIGEGGMGAVFAAEDPRLGRAVALKVMQSGLTDRADSRERFEREARAAATVEHDNIVPVYQVGEDNGSLFIAMPLLHGQSLHARLEPDKRLPVGAAVRVGLDVACGLAAAHAKGLIHRDIKPGNIWLEGDAPDAPGEFRRARVLDFGLARPADDDAHLTGGGVVGTPGYMAPEQAAGERVGERADLFSLGAVLYRCLTGKRPFPGENAMAVLNSLATRVPPTPVAVSPDVPAALSGLVMRLLSKDASRRPASAEAVVAELERVRASLSAPKPPRRRWPVAVGVMLFAALAAVAGVVVVKVRGPDGKETEVRAPEGSTIDVDAKGNVTVTLPKVPKGLAVAPMPRVASVDPERRAIEHLHRFAQLTFAPPGKEWLYILPTDPLPQEKFPLVVVGFNNTVLDDAIKRGALPADATAEAYLPHIADLPLLPNLADHNLRLPMTDEQLARVARVPLAREPLILHAGFELTPRSLAILKKFPNLWSLGCRANLADDENLKRLSEFELTELSLGGHTYGTGLGKSGKVSAEGLQAIAKLPLRRLNIVFLMVVPTEFCKHIASMPDLDHLTLANGKIGDDHLRELARCPKLKVLQLYFTDLTDAGLEHVRNITSLRDVEIDGPKVTAAAAKKLAAARPDLRINVNGTVIEPTKPPRKP